MFWCWDLLSCLLKKRRGEGLLIAPSQLCPEDFKSSSLYHCLPNSSGVSKTSVTSDPCYLELCESVVTEMFLVKVSGCTASINPAEMISQPLSCNVEQMFPQHQWEQTWWSCNHKEELMTSSSSSFVKAVNNYSQLHVRCFSDGFLGRTVNFCARVWLHTWAGWNAVHSRGDKCCEYEVQCLGTPHFNCFALC